MNKVYFLSVFLLLSSITSYGGLQNPLEEKLDSLASFNTTNYQEQVFIHTDRQHYLTGETIKFRVYCLEKSTARKSKLSQIVYVEIIDEANASHLNAKIQLRNGVGFGELYIPTNLLSNHYILRGYTRWMRNYGPSSYFHSIVTLINPFKRLGLPNNAKIENSSVRFFSEGGPLINGQNSRVVCELKDENGVALNKTIRLIANDSLIINEVEVSNNGIGGFQFIPDILNKYHIELLHEDSTITKHTFIPTQGKGLVLSTLEHDDSYSINIFCNDQLIVDQSDDIFLIVQQKNNVLLSKQFSLQRGRFNINLSKALISDGIFTVWLFNEDGDLLRFRKVLKYNEEYSDHAVYTDKNTYSTRERIEFDFAVEPELQDQNDLSYSVSISSIHEHLENSHLSLAEHILLDNSLTGIPHNLRSYFVGGAKEISDNINYLLIAYGKTDTIQWKGNFPKKYIPEIGSHLITGKVKHKTTGDPQSGIMSYLSVPGKRLQFYANRSKTNGQLIFELKDFYGSNEVVVQNDYTKDTLYTIELDNPFSDEYLDIELPSLDLSEELNDWIVQQSQNMQVQNAYKKYAPKPPVVTEIDSSSFYHDPDAKYYLDDYTRFIVMEEVMREYVTGVNVRKNKEGFHFMVVDVDRNIIYQDNPLMLLDAVPVFDADEIIGLDPLKIEKIETIKGRFHYGYLDCQGIVSVTSYNGDLAGYELNENALVFEYNGAQWEREYTFPTYSDAHQIRLKIPDYRNTLFWNPTINLKNDPLNIDIYTSDYASQYEIRVEGIDNDGKVVSGSKIITVQAEENN